MNKVSIIVPVYNTKDYIIRCVDSLVNQTYKDIDSNTPYTLSLNIPEIKQK